MNIIKENKNQKYVYHSARRSGKSLTQMDAAYATAKARSDEVYRQNQDTRQGLLNEGWLPVKCSEYFHSNWKSCHAQCAEMFGEDNYTWTGGTFWFRTQEDIMVFKLTFGA